MIFHHSSSNMRYKVIVLFCFLLFSNSFYGFGQGDAMVKSIKERFDLYSKNALQEKIYLHLDRSLYLIGETVWFKAYYLDGSRHRPLDMSKVAYMEVLDRENNAVVQTKFSLQKGKGNGSVIIPAAIASGNYKVRCYTNWMKNFSADAYFETNISVVNPFVKFDPDPDKEKEATYDVQFFPEGGYLVMGIESKVAFRATNANGKGISFKGFVINDRNDTIVRFQPARYGIGNFLFKPQDSEKYRAVITDSKGKRYDYQLPEIRQQGYVMHVTDAADG
jgi:hypothetical protein